MSNLTMLSTLFRQLVRKPLLRTSTASYVKQIKPGEEEYIIDDDEKKLNVADYLVDDDDADERAAHIEKIRNVSRLRAHDRRRVRHELPYPEAECFAHTTLEYQRKMYGKYGAASGLDPRLLFPTPDELADRAEYESVAFPKTLQQMVEEENASAEAKRQEKLKRENDIAKKLSKLDQWTNELNARVAKKENDARLAKEKRQRLIDEVRRTFGFKMDPRDPKFQMYLDQKEADDKKQKKKMKKELKQEKEMQYLLAQATESIKPSDEATAKSGKPAKSNAKGKKSEETAAKSDESTAKEEKSDADGAAKK